MLNKLNTGHINLLIWLSVFLIFIELLFFHSGLVFSLMLSILFIYIGKKRYTRTYGKILFWLGVFSLAAAVFRMFAAKFFILALIAYFFILYQQSKKEPRKIRPIVLEKTEVQTEALIKKESLLQNRFYGSRSVGEHVYEWNDINIQGAFGDTEIDLSYTVLPKGQSVIFIRHIIGNVRILVPYDMEISVSHSAVIGSARILDEWEPRVFSKNLSYQTAGYDEAGLKVKIMTSFFSGDLEVKRI
ncbi:cell wall-active antibiotics response protein LiaF [Peribacillus sp. SCS-37]|uniref:cell wall-active antibiotics response protein LiaF n=1 Tax=Paraperibacillus esterisolvens TaxID=3115296 RepID=UPI0039068963